MLRVTSETLNGTGLTLQFQVTGTIGRTATCRVLISQYLAEACMAEITPISCTIIIVITAMQRYASGD